MARVLDRHMRKQIAMFYNHSKTLVDMTNNCVNTETSRTNQNCKLEVNIPVIKLINLKELRLLNINSTHNMTTRTKPIKIKKKVIAMMRRKSPPSENILHLIKNHCQRNISKGRRGKALILFS